ncbi:MAG: lipase maturation factor family protein [Deltaproteobacteria bacterium]|nr:lipase maturation factor family protein [Deltaproteobacteria bacterium]
MIADFFATIGLTGSHQYLLTRFCFQRALAFIYCIGFLGALNQYRPLLGERGILPVGQFLQRTQFWDHPSLFWANHSDRFVMAILGVGLALAVVALSGLSEQFGLACSTIVWALLWVFYLSLVNVGQTWYAFGWESILLETGFLAIFLGSKGTAPPEIVIWLIKWVLFRIMFGAGLIKLRGDPCWRNLTCLVYHYETQPIPNPVSWYLHQGPVWFHKAGVLFNHFIELVVPFGIFFPHPISTIAGSLIVLFQVILIVSGNLSWLNYLTLVLCIPCFSDTVLRRVLPLSVGTPAPLGLVRTGLLALLVCLIGWLSINPIRNMVSRRQLMNYSWDPFHLVGTYGAFGGITKARNEIIIEGTSDDPRDPGARWIAYEFKAKPGDPRRRPAVVSPYHLRLDWLMWFAAMSDYRHHPWFLGLIHKLLEGDRRVLALLATNPFPDAPPRFIRARLYRYRFSDPADERGGDWWRRTFIREYLPAHSLAAFRAPQQ